MAEDKLNPTIRQKLRDLAKRRRILLVMRGLFAGVMTLLVAMAAVALIDRFVILGQGVRVAFSLAAYLAVALVVYFVSLRYLLRFPNAARLALLIETAEPQLREDLISAVELAESPSSVYDSPAFREVLQQNVAQRIERVDTNRVLPWKMVAWWGGVSLGAIVITTALLLTPGLRYGDLLTRALLPTADLDRVSDVRITLISPELDADGRVPMNTDLPIVVQVNGGEFDEVVMDIVESQGKRDKANMLRQSDMVDRFTTALAIGDGPVKFRIRAGDGVTRYYELDPTARPTVRSFTQVVHPPDYTNRSATRLTGKDGTIDVLAGSVADLTLATNQPIKSGRLVLELLEGERVVPLYVDPGDATLLTTSMPIDKSGSYRVELVALQTRFVNDDARQYEITARPDALPSVKLVTPEGLHAEPSDALMKLRGLASDDVGLRQVTRATRINGGAWQHQPLATDERGRIVAPLDLLPMGLSIGDEVELRLAATDLAGHTAHSVSARIVVTPDGFERSATQSARDQRELIDMLNKAVASAQDAEQLYKAARTTGGNDQSIERRQAMTRALSAESALQDAIMRAERAVNTAMRSARAGSEAERVLQTGRAIAAAQMRTASQPFASNDATAIEQAERAVSRARDGLRKAATGLRVHAAARQSAITQRQSRLLTDDLARVRDRANQDKQVDRALADERIRRRLQLSNAQANVLIADMTYLSVSPDVDNYRDRYQESIKQLSPLLEAQQGLLRGETEIETIMASTEQVQQELAKARLRQWPAWVFLADRDRDAQHRQRNGTRLDAEVISNLKKQALEGGIEAAFEPVTERLRRRAELEEIRKKTDNSFVAMTNMAIRSLEQLRVDSEFADADAQWVDDIDTIYRSYRTIERVQSLVRLRAMVVSLANAERAGADTIGFALEHRLDWSAIKPQFEMVEQALRKEKSLEQAAKLTREAGHSKEAREVDRSMNDRRDERKAAEAQDENLEAIARMLSEALRSAAPALAEARAALSAKTPTLPERLRELAKQAEQLSEQSEAVSEQAKTQTEQQVVEKAKAIADQQERINAQLDSLAEHFRIEANQEDLFTEEGREVARDFDDAIAAIKPDAENATEQLALAQQETTREHERPQAVAEAAESQQATADKLEQLADHFEKLEQGDAEAQDTRQALRDSEEELGIKQELDAQYKRMERLSELAELSDADRLADLEKQLEKDRNMQRELDRISDDLADSAKQRLEDAARDEGALADQLEKADENQQDRDKALEKLAEDARKLEKESVAPLADKAQKAAPEARPELNEAKEALEQAGKQGDANEKEAQGKDAAQAQQQRAEKLAQQASKAAEELKQASKDAQQAEKNAKNQEKQARQKADQAKRQGKPSPQLEKEANQAAEQAKQAAEVSKEAQDAAKKADAIAREAKKLNQQAEKQDQQAQAQREQGAADQAQHAEQAEKAAEELERAARHEERLGETERADTLADSAKDTRDLTQKDLPETADKVTKEEQLAKAAEAVRSAEEALREQADKIGGAEQSSATQGEAADGTAPSGEEQGSGAQTDSEATGQSQAETADPGQQQGEQQAGPAQSGDAESKDQGAQESAGAQSGESGSDEGEQAPLPQAVAEQLARELDRLDEALNGAGNTDQPAVDGRASEDGSPAQGKSTGQQAQGQSPTQGQEGQASQSPSEGQGQPESEGDAQAQGQSQGQEQGQGEGQASSQGEGQSPSESQAASGSRPIDQAAQAQAQAIRDARAPSEASGQPGQPGQSQSASAQQGMPGQPGQQTGPAAGENGNAGDSDFDPEALVDADTEDDGRRDWGDLPERMAEDLSRSQRERAPTEYLDQVDAYFRAIARRAKEQDNED
jgi:hypothetical protein